MNNKDEKSRAAKELAYIIDNACGSVKRMVLTTIHTSYRLVKNKRQFKKRGRKDS